MLLFPHSKCVWLFRLITVHLRIPAIEWLKLDPVTILNIINPIQTVWLRHKELWRQAASILKRQLVYMCFIYLRGNINQLKDERELFAVSPLCAELRNYSSDVRVIIHSAAHKWLQVVRMYWFDSDWSVKHIGGTAENNSAAEKEFWDAIHVPFHQASFPILSWGYQQK